MSSCTEQYASKPPKTPPAKACFDEILPDSKLLAGMGRLEEDLSDQELEALATHSAEMRKEVIAYAVRLRNHVEPLRNLKCKRRAEHGAKQPLPAAQAELNDRFYRILSESNVLDTVMQGRNRTPQAQLITMASDGINLDNLTFIYRGQTSQTPEPQDTYVHKLLGDALSKGYGIIEDNNIASEDKATQITALENQLAKKLCFLVCLGVDCTFRSQLTQKTPLQFITDEKEKLCGDISGYGPTIDNNEGHITLSANDVPEHICQKVSLFTEVEDILKTAIDLQKDIQKECKKGPAR